MIFGALLTCLSALIVVYYINKDYNKGLFWAIFFFVLFGKNVYLFKEILSAHRLIIIILFMNYFINKQYFRKRKSSFIFFILLAIWIFKLISASLGVNSSLSLKKGVIFLIEAVLYYYIIAQYPQNTKQIESIYKAMFVAFSIVAFFGMLEKYTNFNINSYLPTASGGIVGIVSSGNIQRIVSTYLNPILFGVAMSIGWVFGILLLIENVFTKSYSLFIWLSVLIMFGNVYFSQSRGAWISTILAFSVLFVFYKKIRTKLLGIIFLIVLVLLLNPGVRYTIQALTEATFNQDSVEGASVAYRFELWKQARYLISRSSKSLLFGYGEEGRNYMYLGERESVTGHTLRFDSWDSEFAVLLLETGFIGFSLNILLSLTVLLSLLKQIMKKNRSYLIILAFIVVLIINFMMTNVKIFAVQIWFVYWGVLAMYTASENIKIEENLISEINS